jgi:hypothetical protein
MNTDNEKQYAERDLIGLDAKGNHYCRHVMAMTSESLHSKSDIAAELGYRDLIISELNARLVDSQREFRSADITMQNLEAQLKQSKIDADCYKKGMEASNARLVQLAAENAGLKAAFDEPQAYLSWHAIPPTWEDPLPCGEYLDVHDEAGHKNSDGTDCWPVFAKPEIETPATDAFLAEVRAQGVDMLGQYHNFSEKLFIQKEAQKFAARLRKGAAL